MATETATTGARPPLGEREERAYLSETVERLNRELARVEASITSTSEGLDDQKQFLWEHRRDMDGSEKAAFRSMVDVNVTHGESAVRERENLRRLLDSPYFGRVDFVGDTDGEVRAVYIGTHSFRDSADRSLRIHDWRAPVSGLYYDFETGDAHFSSPEGTVHGSIKRKFQYKTSGGALEYMLESSLNIGDDLLQRELSRSADDKMRNIVATIQREQNAVIRNESASVLILQGVAGSGKTSIALHRVAFLLYRFKDTLTADDVLILSPNRVFGDYIANVLPELGEENVAQTNIEDLAARLLDRKIGWQSFREQVAALIERPDAASAERIRFKATAGFVTALDEWIARCAERFAPADISVLGERLGADWTRSSFEALGPLPIFTRLQRLGDAAIADLKRTTTAAHRKWTASATNDVRRQIRDMFPFLDPAALYEAFFADTGQEHLFRRIDRKTLEFADVFPLLYVTLRTSRTERYREVRHLLVDEMQDYTPVQYAVLRTMFSCRMTILGDANQSVNPFSSSSLESIREVFPDAECLELRRSYRSTREITEFALRVSPNDRLIPVDRHGDPPSVDAFPDDDTQDEAVRRLVAAGRADGHQSIGVVCKTDARAERYVELLRRDDPTVSLLSPDSDEFSSGVIVASAQMAKGLEFDAVIVPDVDDETYSTDLDRSLLYIACTRAMHELHLTHVGTASPFVAGAPR